MDSSWEIQWDRLSFVKVLGAGQFGEVQLMALDDADTSARRLVAVKTLRDPVRRPRSVGDLRWATLVWLS